MNFNSVTFYNHYGNGDLWISREFVRNIMSLFPTSNFYYSHGKDHHLLFDFPELGFSPINEYCNMRQPYVICGDTLYINTWLGYAYGKYIFPGITLSLANFKRMFNDTLSSLQIDYRFLNRDFAYVPLPNYTHLDDKFVDNVHKFVFNNTSKTLVLISNGNVQSNQASNFDFRPIVESLSAKYPNIYFIITAPYENLNLENVVYVADIINKREGSDLPEISYLSQFMDIIVGRSSGPYVFSQTKNNYNNKHMKILGFTYQKACAHMLENEDALASLYWSPSETTELALIDIERIINE